MISRASLGRPAQFTLRRQCLIQQSTRRGLAAPASGTFSYETSDAVGVRIASRDLPGPMTTVAVVAKAGTRYQTRPGFADGLENFAFKVRFYTSTSWPFQFTMLISCPFFQSTAKRSSLRITREVELLGGQLSVYHSRENLVVGAKFLRDDLPYFVELLGEVISKTKYTRMCSQDDIGRGTDGSS